MKKKHQKKTAEEAWSKVYSTAYYFYNRRNYDKSLEKAEKSLAMARDIFNKKHCYIADSLIILALSSVCKNDNHNIDEICQEAFNIYKETVKENSSISVCGIKAIAEAYCQKGLHKKALYFYQQALKIGLENYDTDFWLIHNVFVGAIENLIAVNSLSIAKTMCIQAINFSTELTFGCNKKDIRILQIYHLLAIIFMRDNSTRKRADVLQNHVIKELMQYEETASYELLTIFGQLSLILWDNDECQKAEKILKKMLLIQSEHNLMVHEVPDLQEIMISLANNASSMKKYSYANLIYNKILLKEEAKKRSVRPKIIEECLAGLMHVHGELGQKEALFERCIWLIDFLEKNYGPDYLLIGDYLTWLIPHFFQKGLNRELEDILFRRLHIYEKNLSTPDHRLVDALERLAEFYRVTDNEEKSHFYQLKAEKMQSEVK